MYTPFKLYINLHREINFRNNIKQLQNIVLKPTSFANCVLNICPYVCRTHI